MHLLPAYKNELLFSVKNFEEQAEKLQAMSLHYKHKDHMTLKLFENKSGLASAKRRRKLEEDYLDMEAKLSSAFSVVESIKQLIAQSETFCRKDNQDVQMLIGDLQKVNDDVESIERPDLRVEIPITMRWRKRWDAVNHLFMENGVLLTVVVVMFLMLSLTAFGTWISLDCQLLTILKYISTYNTKVYCRQTLIGGNYGLIHKDTFVPIPPFTGIVNLPRVQLLGAKFNNGCE